MAIPVRQDLDLGSVARITNLLDGTDPQHPATVAQVNAAIEGIKYKDARAGTTGNTNIASPGATHDGVTLDNGDLLVVLVNTDESENGLYVFNGAATPLTRAPNANTAAEVTNMVVAIGDEGTTLGGTQWRQSEVITTLDTDDLIFVSFGTAAPPASTTVAGLIEIAIQAEVDAGTDTARAVTPETLADSVWAKRKYATDVGNGSATSFAITHNLDDLDVVVQIRENGGSERLVFAEVQTVDADEVTVVFASAPTTDQYRVVVIG